MLRVPLVVSQENTAKPLIVISYYLSSHQGVAHTSADVVKYQPAYALYSELVPL